MVYRISLKSGNFEQSKVEEKLQSVRGRDALDLERIFVDNVDVAGVDFFWETSGD